MTEGGRYTTSEERADIFPQARFLGKGSKSVPVEVFGKSGPA